MATVKNKKRKPRPQPQRPTLPSLPGILNELNESALALRNDMQRIMGTVAGASPSDTQEKTLHRFRSLTGRIRFTVNTSSRLIGALQSLRRFTDLA